MYYIYADEAGTSAKEPVTVVVGVIIHADRDWRAALEALEFTLDEHVPEKLRNGFTFHGKTDWSGYRAYDGTWSRNQRAAFIEAVASIPRKLGMAVSIARVRRDWNPPIDPKSLTLADFHHLTAFSRCMARANKYVRDWAAPGEVATVVAEDVPEKRRYLKKVLRAESVEFPLTPEFVSLTTAEIATGRVMQTHAGPVDRIIDTVHFVEKDEAPLLQLADACAFSFRRYFSGQSHGEDMVRSMLGGGLEWGDWQGPISEMTFSFNPGHRYPMRA